MQHKPRPQTWSESTEKGLVDVNEMLDFGHNMGLGEIPRDCDCNYKELRNKRHDWTEMIVNQEILF